MKRENITNPDKDPVHGDWIKDTFDDGSIMAVSYTHLTLPTKA